MTIGRVYSIRSHSRPDLIYYGSTKETLSRRMAGHRSAYKMYLNGKHPNQTSFRLLELGDDYIELVQLVEFTEKAQLHAVEGGFIREHQCVNKFIPCRNAVQYHIDNRAKINARSAAYDAVNAAYKQEKHDCPCGGKHTTKHKPAHVRTARHTSWLATQPPPTPAV